MLSCGFCSHAQISKDAKAAQPHSSHPQSPAPNMESSLSRADSGSGPRSPRSPRSPQFRQPTIPEVATLLEFVAWVVFCEVPASARSANWFKGRGGFLADQLDAVREASIRVQAGPSLPSCMLACAVHQMRSAFRWQQLLCVLAQLSGSHLTRQFWLAKNHQSAFFQFASGVITQHDPSCALLCRGRCKTR